MFKVPSGSSGLSSDAGDSDASVAGPICTSPKPCAIYEKMSLAQLVAAYGHLDHPAARRGTDNRDRQTDSCNDRRAEGDRSKHKWSTVKLVTTAKSITEEQAHARAQATIENDRALSIPSLKALPQQRERRSSVGLEGTVQRKQTRSRSPETTPIQDDARRHYATPSKREFATIERANKFIGSAALSVKLPPNLRQRVDGSVKPKLGFTTDDKATETSTEEEEKKSAFVESLKRALEAQESKDSVDAHRRSKSYTSFDLYRGVGSPTRDTLIPMVSPDLNELPPRKFRTLRGSTRANDSEDDTSNEAALGSDNSECTEQHMLDKYADSDDSGRSRSSTPVRYTPTSGSEDQEARQTKVTDDRNCWCNACVTDLCHGCKYGCGLFDDAPDDFPRDDESAAERSTNVSMTSVDGAECVLLGVLESTVEEDQATKSLTPPRQFRLPRPDIFTRSLEEALKQLGFDHYRSVDMKTLQRRLKERLSLSQNNHSMIASAFATIVKHQDETGCFDLRLRWNEDFDQRLSNDHSGSHHHDWSWATADLETTAEDCRQRWATIKPEGWKPKSICRCCHTDEWPCCCCPKETWTPWMDDKLLVLKSDCSTWAQTAQSMGKTVNECRERFKQIKPKDWKPKSKTQIKKEKAAPPKKQQAEEEATATVSGDNIQGIHDATGEGFATSPCGGDVVNNGSECTHDADPRGTVDTYYWGDAANGANTSGKPLARAPGAAWGTPTCNWCGSPFECAHHIIDEEDHNTQGATWTLRHCSACDLLEELCKCAGWASPAASDNGCWEASSNKTTSEPQPAPYTPPIVTYWATIEFDGKQIHVPIDSKNISGPEKDIATGAMKKVWKWVHDKGLGDKIGLQDAFDLAQSMHKEEVIERAEPEKANSRTESRLSYRTPGKDSRYGYR